MTRHLIAAALVLSGSIGPAAALSDPTGIWTLSEAGTPRQCRLQLRTEATATGQAVAMPPGCRRAFPIIASVRSWSVPDGVHLALNDGVGANVLMFAEADDGRLQAAGPEDNGAYILTALAPRRAAAVPPPAAPPAGLPDDPVFPAPVHAPVTVSGVAGHYAVMRGSRDTGCMVTLDEGARATQAPLKARLAPACRDQGIIVFDPVGWALKGGQLVLEARKGHTALFSSDSAGIWVKDAKTGQPLGLKRL